MIIVTFLFFSYHSILQKSNYPYVQKINMVSNNTSEVKNIVFIGASCGGDYFKEIILFFFAQLTVYLSYVNSIGCLSLMER